MFLYSILFAFIGSIPKIENEVSTQKVCLRGYTTCCEKTIDVDIKNCGQYHVYKHKSLDTCYGRYCLGMCKLLFVNVYNILPHILLTRLSLRKQIIIGVYGKSDGPLQKMVHTIGMINYFLNIHGVSSKINEHWQNKNEYLQWPKLY